MKRYLISLVFFLLFYCSGDAKKVLIKDQQDFNNLSKWIISAVRGTDSEIIVSFLPGIYEVDNNHIILRKILAPGKSIRIVGNGAVLVPKGREYFNGDSYKGDFSINHSWMNGVEDLDLWSNYRYADSLVEVMDKGKKECRIKVPESYDYNDNSYILITHWFSSSVCKINRIDKNYIYFTADDLTEKRGVYNLNNDYSYGKTYPRYKLCNIDTGEDRIRVRKGKIHLPVGVRSVREGYTYRFFSFTDCTFNSIELTGFKFLGGSDQNKNTALYINKMQCDQFRIHKCEFYGMRSNVVTVLATANVLVDNNVFQDCHLFGVRTDNECTNSIIKDNSFALMGKRMINTFCVTCSGSNFVIEGNSFKDYGYGGIGVGVWYNNMKQNLCTGIVENNVLSYSDSYLANIENVSLMDGGAIYLWTKNDDVIIRNNYIFNYSGMCHNCGVFCDDGAYNYQIVGNVIMGTKNSHSIEARRVKSVEEKNSPGSSIERANINIVIKDNIVDGSILFVGNEAKNNGCILGDNYVLLADKQTLPKNTIANVTVVGDIITLTKSGEIEGRIGITRKSYKQLKHNPSWNRLRSFFVSKK